MGVGGGYSTVRFVLANALADERSSLHQTAQQWLWSTEPDDRQTRLFLSLSFFPPLSSLSLQHSAHFVDDAVHSAATVCSHIFVYL